METSDSDESPLSRSGPETADEARGKTGPKGTPADASPQRIASRSRVSFPSKEPKPAWDNRKKSKPGGDKLGTEARAGGAAESPQKSRAGGNRKASASQPGAWQAESLTSQAPGKMDQGSSEGITSTVPGSGHQSRPAPLHSASTDPPSLGAASAGVARLDSARRAVRHVDAGEVRKLEDMLAKVKEVVELERKSMLAERERSDASCAGVLERATHSWLRLWQVQRVYAGGPEATLVRTPWRGHLSFPFLLWKKTAQDRGNRRRQRRRLELNLKRRVFQEWLQVGQLSAGVAASLSAFARRRCRVQQRAAFLAWKDSIASRKSAQFKLRKYVQILQANKLHQAWQQWRAGVEVQLNKKARLARARRHVALLRLRVLLQEWRSLVLSSLRAREVLRSSNARLQQRALLRAFCGWREAVGEVQRQRAIMHRAAAHIMHSALAQAFSAWAAKVELQRCVCRFAGLLRQRSVLAAFNTWRAAVQEGKQMEQDLHQVFAHRRESFAGEMLSRWRAWRSGDGASEEGERGRALRRCFRQWRGRLQARRQVRMHAAQMTRQRVFRQWNRHVTWARNLQATTLKARALDRWRAWTSVRVRGKNLQTLEAALASSEERCAELQTQLKQMEEDRNAANQRAADLVAAVRGLDLKLRAGVVMKGSVSPPRSPRVNIPARDLYL